jgi:hypothetical protein
MLALETPEDPPETSDLARGPRRQELHPRPRASLRVVVKIREVRQNQFFVRVKTDARRSVRDLGHDRKHF